VCQVSLRSLSSCGNTSRAPQKKKDAEKSRHVSYPHADFGHCCRVLLISHVHRILQLIFRNLLPHHGSVCLSVSKPSNNTDIFLHTHTRARTRTRMHMRTHIRARAHTHTHTHTHTQIDCAVFAETVMNNMIFRAF
jgi:hypothetical protein